MVGKSKKNRKKAEKHKETFSYKKELQEFSRITRELVLLIFKEGLYEQGRIDFECSRKG